MCFPQAFYPSKSRTAILSTHDFLQIVHIFLPPQGELFSTKQELAEKVGMTKILSREFLETITRTFSPEELDVIVGILNFRKTWCRFWCQSLNPWVLLPFFFGRRVDLFDGSKEMKLENKSEAILLSTARAAMLLGICTKTLHKLEKEGKVKAILIGTRQKRFRRKDLEAFANRKV